MPGGVTPYHQSSAAPAEDAFGGTGRTGRVDRDGNNCDEGDARCERAIGDARRIYNQLMTKRFPGFQSGGRHGRDSGHLEAIISKQGGLHDALRRIRHWCKKWPPEYWEWERAANIYAPGF